MATPLLKTHVFKSGVFFHHKWLRLVINFSDYYRNNDSKCLAPCFFPWHEYCLKGVTDR
jgi:hypothetical protein